jgi:hypothetical protein
MVGQSQGRAMIRKYGLIILLAICLTLCPKSGSATGGGVTHIGTFAANTTDESAGREWIDLVVTGDLLIGRPKHPSVALITVFAPGADSSHLILRVLEVSDKKRSLLLNAPSSLSEKLQRATIYVNHGSKDLILLESQDENWKIGNPQPVKVAKLKGFHVDESELLAFSIKKFGMYWLMESDMLGLPESSHITQVSSASSLVGGGLSRGLLPWLLAVIILILGFSISQVVHKLDRRKGN